MSREKLFLIDGSAIFYRSYFAFIRNPLINSKGENTSATFGFLNTLFKLIEDERPAYLAVIFDTKEPTFRHDIYEEYKATREKMPEEMADTYPRLIDTLNMMNINMYELEGYEADDIIATICKSLSGEQLDIFILSGDKDLAQLVTDNIFLYQMPKNTSSTAEILNNDKIKEKYGVFPDQITDWLALMGDKSDNIPGVPGIGEKRAVALIEEFKTLENILNNTEKIKSEKIKKSIIGNEQKALLSKKLVSLEKKVPIQFTLEDLKLKLWQKADLEITLKDMEFNRLVTRSGKAHDLISGNTSDSLTADVNSIEKKYVLIKNEKEFNALLEKLSHLQHFCFDTETDSLDVFNAEIAGISISFKKGEAFYIALNHPDSDLDASKSLTMLKPVFENREIKKSGQNLKFDALVLRRYGIKTRNIYFDTMIASYLINPSSNQHNLDNLAQIYLDYRMIPIEELIGSGKNQKKMTDLKSELVFTYACEDADIALKLQDELLEKLKEMHLRDLFFKTEMPLASVLLEMENNGVRIDQSILKDMSKELGDKLEIKKKEIFSDAGKEFNINSPQQLGPILFEDLKIHEKLDMRKPPRTKTGQYSTSEQVLERFSRHPLPAKILEYRRLTKLKNTYIDALPELINQKTGKIHTSYNQSVAATGRLSSSNPNLQNIPVRTEMGREIRKAFIASDENHTILSADYSQIELRILAHLSGDEKMRESFEYNIDIHAATASQIFDISLDNVNSEHRRKAKAINFGIIYGMSKYGLANRLEISTGEAEQFIFEYFATYPSIQEYIRNTVKYARENGYVKTMLNRRRYIPQIKSSNRQMREFAERTSINSTIQGSAADMIKIAMIHIQNEIEKNNYNSKMILQVHDELVFDVLKSEKSTIKELVKSKMENALQLNVPVVVDIGEGDNWLEAH